jgi:hypothetical protein
MEQQGLTIAARPGAPSRVLLGEPATREELAEHTLTPRPRTRGECKDGARPCPWAGCAHHLFLDVNADTGSIKLNYPGHTRERVRQIEQIGLRELLRHAPSVGLDAEDVR